MNDKGNGIINSDIESKYSDLIDEKVNRAIDIRIKQYWNYLKVFLQKHWWPFSLLLS